MILFQIVLLTLLIVTALGCVLSKRVLTSIIIFMAYGTVMTVVWMILESPDLALTEAAVGAGITSVLFFLAIRKINQLKEEQDGE